MFPYPFPSLTILHTILFNFRIASIFVCFFAFTQSKECNDNTYLGKKIIIIIKIGLWKHHTAEAGGSVPLGPAFRLVPVRSSAFDTLFSLLYCCARALRWYFHVEIFFLPPSPPRIFLFIFAWLIWSPSSILRRIWWLSRPSVVLGCLFLA